MTFCPVAYHMRCALEAIALNPRASAPIWVALKVDMKLALAAANKPGRTHLRPQVMRVTGWLRAALREAEAA